MKIYSIMLIIGIILFGLFQMIKNLRFKLMFHPNYGYDNFSTKYKIIESDGQCAIHKTGAHYNKCMLISHGNAGNIFIRDALLDNLNNYDGDIYCYEYTGFGLLNMDSPSIDKCVKNCIYWLEYLNSRYDIIDMYGESIGGGITMETIKEIRDKDYYDKINHIYLQSTFSSIKNLLNESFIGSIYSLLGLDDLNTINTFDIIKDDEKKIIIIHSKDDDIIPYCHAKDNFKRCKELKINTIFNKISGTHNNPIGNIIPNK